jgi:pilus assembly protein Flp/PilA
MAGDGRRTNVNHDRGPIPVNAVQNLIARLAGGQSADLSLLRQEDGQTLVEYALILLLIAVVVVGAAVALGGQITSTFNSVVGAI